MTISDNETLLNLTDSPRAVAMRKALKPLSNCISLLNIGTCIDPKTAEMLVNDGIKLSQIFIDRDENAEAVDMTLHWLADGLGDEQRLVHLIRREKPDIICPNFTDEAERQAVLKAVNLAANAEVYPTQHEGEDLPAWQVKAIYLPAELSGDDKKAVFDDLPKSLIDLATYVDAPAMVEPLAMAQMAIDEAIAAWPDYELIGKKAAIALENIIRAQGGCPDSALPETYHRLSDKKRRLTRVLALAHEVNVRVELSATQVKAGGDFVLTIHNETPVLDLSISVRLPDGWETSEWLDMSCEIYVPDDAAPSAAQPDIYYADRANHDLQVILTWQEGGQLISMNIDPENELLILAN